MAENSDKKRKVTVVTSNENEINEEKQVLKSEAVNDKNSGNYFSSNKSNKNVKYGANRLNYKYIFPITNITLICGLFCVILSIVKGYTFINSNALSLETNLPRFLVVIPVIVCIFAPFLLSLSIFTDFKYIDWWTGSKVPKCVAYLLFNVLPLIMCFSLTEYLILTAFDFAFILVVLVSDIIVTKQRHNTVNVIIPKGVKVIGEYAFDECSALESLTIPNTVTSIKKGAFFGCASLEKIVIPFAVTEIQKGVFSDCQAEIIWDENCLLGEIVELAFNNYNGKKITIPKRVTKIGDSAFKNCTLLECVVVPISVKKIGENLFEGCTLLKSITYNGTVEQWKEIDGYKNVEQKVICTNGVVE